MRPELVAVALAAASMAQAGVVKPRAVSATITKLGRTAGPRSESAVPKRARGTGVMQALGLTEPGVFTKEAPQSRTDELPLRGLLPAQGLFKDDHYGTPLRTDR